MLEIALGSTKYESHPGFMIIPLLYTINHQFSLIWLLGAGPEVKNYCFIKTIKTIGGVFNRHRWTVIQVATA